MFYPDSSQSWGRTASLVTAGHHPALCEVMHKTTALLSQKDKGCVSQLGNKDNDVKPRKKSRDEPDLRVSRLME